MSLFVFVLMPFAQKFDKRYEVIKKAVADAGMRAKRVDEQSFYRQGITNKVIEQIEDADILIAELSTRNANVLYEVGYAHAKNKLCVLLTNSTGTIPFDLKDKRHIVFSSLKDLKKKLSTDLELLKAEMELFFDPADIECFRTVPVYITETVIRSQATSIRVKAKPGSELYPKNVSAQMIKIARRSGNAQWKPFRLEQPIPLTWADTNSPLTDFTSSTAKHANVFHVDHNANKLGIWGASISPALANFLKPKATYRVTVSVMGRQARLDVVWRKDWHTMHVKPAS